jgi:hypothetical protein
VCKGTDLKPVAEGFIVNKTQYLLLAKLLRQQSMKKIFFIAGLSFLLACHGNETADSKPTDLDRTKNNDTSAVKMDSLNTIKKDSLDTTHLNK